MNQKPLVLGIEAVLLGGPATVIALYGMPWLLAMSIGGLLEKPAAAGLALACWVGAIWALVQFWRLSTATIRRQSLPFDRAFWLGVTGAVVGTAFLTSLGPSWFVAALIGPIALAALHFSVLQVRARAAQPTLQADGPASGGPAA